METKSFTSHFLELKRRLLYVVLCFSLFSSIGYYFSAELYNLISSPLQDSLGTSRRVIYTGLAEAFFTYIKLSCFFGFVVTIPFISYQIYSFISPGLLQKEKKIIRIALLFAPILFYLGAIFMIYFVIPKAWGFFISFEIRDASMPLILEAKISEYITLVVQLVMAFGVAFEMPVFILILSAMGLFNRELLIKNRRYAIVFIFVFAGIVTPPDVISQIALAIPMILLYEISLGLCKIVVE